jgi:hypothetical protein
LGSINSLHPNLNPNHLGPRFPQSVLDSFIHSNPSLKISNQAWIVLTQGNHGISPPSRCTKIESETMNFFKRIELLCGNPSSRRLKKLSQHAKKIHSLFSLNSPYKAMQVLRVALWELKSGSNGSLNEADRKILNSAEVILLREMDRLANPVGAIHKEFSLFNTAKKLQHMVLKALYDPSKLVWIGAALVGIAILYELQPFISTLASDLEKAPFNPPPRQTKAHHRRDFTPPTPRKQRPLSSAKQKQNEPLVPPKPQQNPSIYKSEKRAKADEPFFLDPSLRMSEEKDFIKLKEPSVSGIFNTELEEIPSSYSLSSVPDQLPLKWVQYETKALKPFLEFEGPLPKQLESLKEDIRSLPNLEASPTISLQIDLFSELYLSALINE